MRCALALVLFFWVCFGSLSAQQFHLVQAGETLFSLSRRYKIPVEKIVAWNRLRNNTIYVGQKLKISAEVQELKLSDLDIATKQTSPSLSQFVYKVKKGDNLGSIAKRYGLCINQLRAWNNLSSTELFPDQILTLKEPLYLSVYSVQRGDTLSGIAQRNAIDLEQLLVLNKLDRETTLKFDQLLILEKPKENQGWHCFKKGDTLSALSLLYGVSEASIRRLNGLGKKQQPNIGSLIKIRETDTARADLTFEEETSSVDSTIENTSSFKQEGCEEHKNLTHTVESGDTLYSIARRYNVLIEDIKLVNNLQDNIIAKGTVLVLPSKLRLSETREDKKKSSLISDSESLRENGSESVCSEEGKKLPATVALESDKPLKNTPPRVDKTDFSHVGSLKSLVVLDPKIPLYEWNRDYYYWKHPELTYQPSKMYFEQWDSPLDAYCKATQLFRAFAKLVDTRPKVSQMLKGKTIIIDPGHGGLDPGAVVRSKDGLGRDIYITEDEYVYDIALRMYVLLKGYGAEVYLTILAPDHLIRDTSPASNTLVNMKNEVYNLESLNLRDSKDCWPNGTQEGLARRVEVIKHLAQGKDNNSLVFVSLHADNQPSMPRYTGILYQHNAEMNDGYSQKMAEIMQEAMDQERVYVKGQDLYVLRNAPLKYKVLIELRNVSSAEEAWALRFADMRQGDAEKVVKGILAFFKSLT